MPGKAALLDFSKCRPEQCLRGACAAAEACPHKLIRQEAPYDTPMFHPSTCRGCGDCARACPAKAIKVVTV